MPITQHEIRIYSKASGYTDYASLPPRAAFGDASWSIEPNAGFSDFSLSIPEAEAGEWEGVIVHGDRVEVYDRHGLRRYRGYVTDLDRSESEPPMLSVGGYGRILDLTAILLRGDYDYADKVDVSTIFAEIAADVNSRHPDIQIESQVVGREVERLGALRRSARDAFDDLLGFAKSVAHYGYDVSSFGRDRLYLRQIGTEVTHRFPLASVWAEARSSKRSSADVFNVVTVEGGAPDFPQLLPNGSFEALVRAGDGSGNLVKNPSFESNTTNSSTDEWSVFSGASFKTQGGDEASAYDGAWACEIDTNSEKVSQTVNTPAVALVPGHDYTYSFWARPESFSTDLDNPPVVRGRLVWLTSAGGAISNAEVSTDARYQKWESYEVTSKCPASATKFRVELELVDEGVGGTSGVLVDQVSVADATTLVAQGWGFKAFGTAQVRSANWSAKGAYHGRNCLSVVVTASDVDGQDIHIRMTPEYRIAVVGGQSIRFSERIKSGDGVTLPKHLFEFRWLGKDGEEVGHDKVALTPSSAFSVWSYQEAVREAPADATELECWITLRGSGSFMLDAVSVRDAADEAQDYLEPGNLVLTYSVDEVLNILDPADAFNSISVYGVREKAIRADGITTIADARAYAREWLLFHAALYDAPQIEIRDYDLDLWVGDLVELTGADGSLYAGRPMPVARINCSLDEGVVVYQIELQVAEPTDEELLDAFIEDKIREKTTGAPALSGGGGSGRGSIVATGAVKSVALTVPGGFSVSGSPVTGSGTLAISTALSGIVKGTGSGFTIATAGADYLAPIAGSTNQTLRFTAANTLAATSNLTNNGTLIVVGTTITQPSVEINSALGTIRFLEPLRTDGSNLGDKYFCYGELPNGRKAGFYFDSGGREIGFKADSSLLFSSGGNIALSIPSGQFQIQANNGNFQLAVYGSAPMAFGVDRYRRAKFYTGIQSTDPTVAAAANINLGIQSGQTAPALTVRADTGGESGTGTLLASISASGAILGASLAATGLTGLIKATGGTLGNAISGTDYAAAAHNHSALDITTGTLPLTRGGTGGTDAASARTSLGLGTAATRNTPIAGNAATGEVVLGSDTRLTDARTPLAHTHSSIILTGGAFGDTTAFVASASGQNGIGVSSTASRAVIDFFALLTKSATTLQRNMRWEADGAGSAEGNKKLLPFLDQADNEPELQIGQIDSGVVDPFWVASSYGTWIKKGYLRAEYRAADNTPGASATTGGATFKNGLYISGTIAGMGGTVTSVGLAVPAGFTVSGSPVTGSGTLTITTTLSGVLKGTGSGFAAATAGTDYLAPISGTTNQTLRFSAANTLSATSGFSCNGHSASIGASGYFPSRHTVTSGYGSLWFDTSNSGITGETSASYRGLTFSANVVRSAAANDWVVQDTTQGGYLASIGYESNNNGFRMDRLAASGGFTNVFQINLTQATFAAPLKSSTGFVSADGTAGASATTGGATFKNGLYVSGTIAAGGGGGGASGGTGFRLSRAAGYQTAIATNTFYPDDGLRDADDTTAYSKAGVGVTGSAVTALYDLRAVVDQTPVSVASVVTRIGYKRTPSIAVEYSNDGSTWTTAPTMFSPTTALHGGSYAVEDYNLTLSAPTNGRFWRLSLKDGAIGSQATQASIARFLLLDADGNSVQ